ncbi:MAG: tRNA uridine-5-carboxymethylaminomethyl(34) synthesis GTPase MnmE [Syntrophaceae bacterium]|nr:tRNA uridine-5-carboxymethylaminomethyl(34) synthesis GTPase MnmE [Syntrophaceae bacterium]
MLRHDTIAAIATPPGVGGVGIIRISGPDACKIARQIFLPKQTNCSWKSHHLYYGDIIAADGKTILDEVLATLMPGPHSFTGEDVLEINCHGSPVIMQAILAELVQSGCRLARPGEFSQRAFLNGRIDLSQAEALATLIAARSEKARAIALAHLKGALAAEIESLRLALIEALALTEVSIDFMEDAADQGVAEVLPQLDTLSTRLQLLLDSYRKAKVYTEGLNVVITGKPNVGKSSLLNTLTGRKRAIVTDIPGTTRDFITDQINIRGIPVNLVDTAGIRQPQDIIEKEGIDLVWENLAGADLIIILLDGSKPLTGDDKKIFAAVSTKNYLIVINKTDLPSAWEISELIPGSRILKISAKFGTGINELKEAIVDSTGAGEEENSEMVMITNMRHKVALEKALDNIKRAKENAACTISPELTAFDLREALDSLDEITGKKIDDEILDKIFSSFCIGK